MSGAVGVVCSMENAGIKSLAGPLLRRDFRFPLRGALGWWAWILWFSDFLVPTLFKSTWPSLSDSLSDPFFYSSFLTPSDFHLNLG